MKGIQYKYIKHFRNKMRFPIQVWRSFKKRKSVRFVVWPLFLVSIGLLLFRFANQCLELKKACPEFKVLWDIFQAVVDSKWFQISFVTIFICLAIALCQTLTRIYSINRKETAITTCLILILVLIGTWILAIFVIFDLRDTTNKAIMGGFSFLLALIFQDTIKGVVSFIHLRFNNQLRIDDWIQVPGKGVDGEVRHVSLTKVTISNWDTTTSCIPTSMLHSEHFINLKNMMDGKTFGRRMFMTFILDTNWMHPISDAEASALIERCRKETDVLNYIPEKEITAGKLNAELFRLYRYCPWLRDRTANRISGYSGRERMTGHVPL